ncbi:retroviral-like aspartic protease family protein [Porticoccaceae bacterium]|nr:retroviral-like aspartic protease family protein [Porticoccaceae bacterium]MDB2633906.1 retroviral-like aspartic protease family protein [Porticoccaceae bacterium]MDB2664487.1 retroviral-like aspartic protease family protein [Porticoccaceae bacterium]
MITKQAATITLGFLVLFSFAAGWFTNNLLKSDSAIELPMKSSLSESSFRSMRQPEVVSTYETMTIDSQDADASLSVSVVLDSLDEFSRSLALADYSLALDQYQDIASLDKVGLARAKSRLLTHLDQLLESSSDQQFVDLTGQYLSTFYDDVDVLLYLATFNYSRADMVEAAAVYRLIKSYAYSAAQMTKLRQSLDIFVDRIDLHYRASGGFDELTTIYAQLDDVDLLPPRHQLAYAKAYLSLGNIAAAKVLLNRLAKQSELAPKVLALLSQIESQELADIEPVEWFDSDLMTLKPRGNQFSLDLKIADSDVDLLIDTGASMTTITQKRFQRLFSDSDFSYVEQRLFNTANGIIKGSVYRVPFVRLGRFTLRDVNIAVLDFDLSEELDGLLGMNILGQFQFQINQGDAILRLSERY